jgi:hypothetical protein
MDKLSSADNGEYVLARRSAPNDEFCEATRGPDVLGGLRAPPLEEEPTLFMVA